MGSEGAAVSVERPIFACKAHVFHIDPKTKRSWLSASTTSINVTMFYDSARGLYRIISMEGTKALINSTVTPNMVFTKTSQKFGQWSDVRANTVYGLGFESEFALNKFIEKFNEIKEAIRVASPNDTGQQIGTTPTCCPVSGLTPSLAGMNVNNNVSANASPLSSRSNVPFADPGVIDPPNIMQPTTPNSMPPPAAAVACDENDSESKSDHKSNHQNRNAAITTAQTDSPKHQVVDTKAPPVPPLPSQAALSAAESQLKYENDRLKLALAHSSANAKKWEVELATLKNNNHRLTSALQESTANVDEWKKQLQSYKEENQRLKNKYLDLEAHKGGSEGTPELRKELDVLRTRADNLEKELKAKDEDIKKLSRAEGQIEDRFKALMGEHAELQATLGLTHSQLEMAMAAQESQRRVIETLNAQLASRIQELANIHRELNTALQI